jgi:mono/diheme cytochrome c family protein
MNGGLSTMPGFKDRLKPAQMRDVAAFLAKATNG